MGQLEDEEARARQPFSDPTKAIDSAADHIADAIDRNTAQQERLEAAVLTAAMSESEQERASDGRTRRHMARDLFRTWLAEIRAEKETDHD